MTIPLSPFAADWIRGKTAEDFEIIEHLGGRLLWPVTIQRLKPGTEKKPVWLEEAAFLHTLDGLDLLDALEQATRLFDERGLKKDDPRHQAIWGVVETHALVALALREAVDGSGKPYPPGAVHPQKCTLETLLSHQQSGIPPREVHRLYDVLQRFGRFEEAKMLGEVDKETAIRLALSIAEVGNLTPLLAIDGPEQDRSIVYICETLRGYLLPSS